MAEEEENEVIEEEEEECPKCPPVGAPAWMATFADMATLLMAFFVLILSFAEFNVPKFKQISGSLKNAFGVQKIVPIVEQPKGTTVLSLNFSPSPAKSVTNEMTQQTTETTKPEIETQTKNKDSDGSGEKQNDAEEVFTNIIKNELKNGLDEDLFNNAKKEFILRLKATDWNKFYLDNPFKNSGLALFHWSPIADELKVLDKEIVLNSIMLKWNLVKNDFKDMTKNLNFN